MRLSLSLFFLTGCSTGSGTQSTCYNLCQELVQTCDYSAYPTFSSCEEGCLYYQDEGADIEAQLTCIQESECNEFDVIECEHAHGVDNESE